MHHQTGNEGIQTTKRIKQRPGKTSRKGGKVKKIHQVFPMFLRKDHLWTSSFPKKGSFLFAFSLPLCRGGGVDRWRQGETLRHGRQLCAAPRVVADRFFRGRFLTLQWPSDFGPWLNSLPLPHLTIWWIFHDVYQRVDSKLPIQRIRTCLGEEFGRIFSESNRRC